MAFSNLHECMAYEDVGKAHDKATERVEIGEDEVTVVWNTVS